MQDSFSRMKFMKQKGLSRLWSRQNCAYVMWWNSFETNVKKRNLKYIQKYNFSRKLLRLIDHFKYNKLQTPTEYFLTAFINNPKLWNKWAKTIGLEKLLKQIWKVSLRPFCKPYFDVYDMLRNFWQKEFQFSFEKI